MSTERKTDLLDAWKGLLWIPPAPAERQAGITLSVDRAVRCLLALHEAAGDSADGLPILRHAVRLLGEAYPRSPEFWSDHLSPLLGEWPELLRGVVYEQWPLIATNLVENGKPGGGLDKSGWPTTTAQLISEVAEPPGTYDPLQGLAEKAPAPEPRDSE